MLEQKKSFSEGALIAAKYRVLSIAGSGGMGMVYCARDEQLERTVALKFLPAELITSQGDQERFLREARTASKLDHPNIGVVHGIEKTENDLTFIVMAFYDGSSLAERIHNGPVSASEAMGIARQMALGLAEAHAHGIVHRDVKPSNVMLTRSGVIKIVDFGLARFMSDATASQTGISGTVRYMAPEQAMNRTLDQRCDIWALGVVLAEMLTGISPFHADSVTGMLFSILNEAPKGLELIDPHLQPILYRALAKDPDRRYASCTEFLADLDAAEKHIRRDDPGQEVTQGLPPSARPGKASRRALEAAASRRPLPSGSKEGRRWKTWLLATLAILLTAGLAVSFVPSLRDRIATLVMAKPQVRHVAVLPFETLGSDPENRALADGLMESLTGRLSNLDDGNQSLWIVPSSEVRRRHVNDPTDAMKQLGANLVIKGAVERKGGDIHLTLNLIETRNLRQLGSAVLDDSTGNLSTLQDEAVSQLAKLMNIRMAANVARIESGRVNPAAYEGYLTAVGLMQRWDKPGNLDQAIVTLQNALKTDPEFALGYAELGEAY